MKNWNLWYFVGLLLILYVGNGMVDELKSGQKRLEDKMLQFQAKAEAITTRLNANEKESADFYKLQKNQDVWQGTACINCHNTLATALPIYKRTIPEAIEIVRNGNENSKAGGMPTYTSRATRDKNSITDSELKVRLDALYTQELLQYAKDKIK